jgi:hypothetical protein
MFFGEIRRSIPSYAQGFGGLSSSHSSTAIGRGLLRRRIKLPRLPSPLMGEGGGVSRVNKVKIEIRRLGLELQLQQLNTLKDCDKY